MGLFHLFGAMARCVRRRHYLAARAIERLGPTSGGNTGHNCGRRGARHITQARDRAVPRVAATAVNALQTQGRRSLARLAFGGPDFAPRCRADVAFDKLAGVRRLELAAIAAPLVAFWRILIFDDRLRHFIRSRRGSAPNQSSGPRRIDDAPQQNCSAGHCTGLRIW